MFKNKVKSPKIRGQPLFKKKKKEKKGNHSATGAAALSFWPGSELPTLAMFIPPTVANKARLYKANKLR